MKTEEDTWSRHLIQLMGGQQGKEGLRSSQLSVGGGTESCEFMNGREVADSATWMYIFQNHPPPSPPLGGVGLMIFDNFFGENEKWDKFFFNLFDTFC